MAIFTKKSFFLAFLWGGGAERSMLRLANSLAEKSLKVDLIININSSHE